MSRPISKTGTASSHPVSYDSGYSAYSVSGLDNALTDSSSTTYATINFTRGSGAATGDKIMIKSGGSWVEGTPKIKVSGAWREVSKVFKKVNGSWVEQSDKSAMFDPNAIYIGG